MSGNVSISIRAVLRFLLYSLPNSTAAHMRNSLGGVSGAGELAQELMNLVIRIRWKSSRDLVRQFYLLARTFDTLNDANTPQARKLYEKQSVRFPKASQEAWDGDLIASVK